MDLPVLRESKPYAVAASVVRKLQENGFVAYFAGGSIRDALRGTAPKDIDIATSAKPNEVQGLFRRTIPVGVQFGVVRVLEGDFEFEVATFRSDGVYLDGRHPQFVEFSTPEKDALRRDFTVNGIFYDPVKDEVIDFVGGREDLGRKLIRAIGLPSHRFAEDRLRMLRAARVAWVLGCEIESGRWSAILAAASGFLVVRRGRGGDELLKILVD